MLGRLEIGLMTQLIKGFEACGKRFKSCFPHQEKSL